jgi:hypothetical protein
MNTPTPALTLNLSRNPLAGWLRESLQRQRLLTVFGLLMLAAMLPALLALALDARMLRGVSVWMKPLKFMASVGLFSLTTAWFAGLVSEAQRDNRVMRGVAWVVVVAGGLEVFYISLQAALGQASHFNFTDKLHALLYQLMGVGAVAMCITQAVLAQQIARHPQPGVNLLWQRAVRSGLWLTLLLGAGTGIVLAGIQPPSGAGLPVVGWHGAGDLRMAHFLGMHAQQLLPLAGWLLVNNATAAPQWRSRVLTGAAMAYVLLWAAALLLGLQGAAFKPPL